MYNLSVYIDEDNDLMLDDILDFISDFGFDNIGFFRTRNEAELLKNLILEHFPDVNVIITRINTRHHG